MAQEEFMNLEIDVPKKVVEDIWTFNGEHPGYKGHHVNITQTCIDALRAALKTANQKVDKEKRVR